MENEPKPVSPYYRVNLYIPKELYIQLKVVLAAKDTTASLWMREVITEFISQQPNNQP